jgi:hypothetical protein
MLQKSALQPNAAITGTGVLIGCGVSFFAINTSFKNLIALNPIIGFKIPDAGRKVDIVQGFSGVLYKRRFFPSKEKLYDELFSYSMNDFDLFKSDDIVLSGYLSKKNIDRYTFNDMPAVDVSYPSNDALAADAYKMLITFHKTLYKCRDLGMFPKFEQSSLTDSAVFNVPFLFLMFVFLIVATIIFVNIKIY